MSKKKEIEEQIVEEVIVESDPTEEFIDRTLKVINSMSNKAKAKRLAERVLANRKGN